MIKMSFYDGTLNETKAIEIIKNSDKPCVYTYGFKYRNPTTREVPISKERAIEIISQGGFLDITEYEDRFDLNTYSSNDMW